MILCSKFFYFHLHFFFGSQAAVNFFTFTYIFFWQSGSCKNSVCFFFVFFLVISFFQNRILSHRKIHCS